MRVISHPKQTQLQDVRTLFFCNCKFLPCYDLNCSACERAPRFRVTEKSQLFHTKRRSGQNLVSNPGQLRDRQRLLPLSNPLRPLISLQLYIEQSKYPSCNICKLFVYFLFHTMIKYWYTDYSSNINQREHHKHMACLTPVIDTEIVRV
jgi:hypothetical protein